jgi:HSP20 family molecular chaperone IbpA
MPTALPESQTPLPGLVGHPHNRPRQRDTFFGVVLHKEPSQKAYPYPPDVNIRDVLDHYVIDVDLPGINDPNSILLSCISRNLLAVSRSTFRTGHQKRAESTDACELEVVAGDSDSVRNEIPLINDDGINEAEHSWRNKLLPWLALEEQRTGSFRRDFYFPRDADMSKTKAILGFGLLHIEVPKIMHSGWGG